MSKYSININLTDNREFEDQIMTQALKRLVRETEHDIIITCWHKDDVKHRRKVTKAAMYLLNHWLLDPNEQKKFKKELENDN